jgi:SAM-dependent methyltransferase
LPARSRPSWPGKVTRLTAGATIIKGSNTLRLSPVQRTHRDRVLRKIATGEYTLEVAPACLCGTSGGFPLAQRDRYGIPVGVLLCQACGLARTTPRLATTALRDFYEHEYHGLHQGVVRPEPSTALFRSGQGKAIYSFMSDALPAGAFRVADIGAGTGQVLREFIAAAGGRATGAGCEYSQAFVAAGQLAGRDLRQGGPESLADIAPFDVVLMSHIVEHFPNPVTDLQAVRVLGGPDTVFYVEVPGLLTINTKSEYAYSFDQYVTLAHTFHFSQATLAATMLRAGFELVKGDELVRSIFRQGPIRVPRPDAGEADRILLSLAKLEGLRMRIRRSGALGRQAAAVVAKRLLPAHVVAGIRRAKERST